MDRPSLTEVVGMVGVACCRTMWVGLLQVRAGRFLFLTSRVQERDGFITQFTVPDVFLSPSVSVAQA